MNPKDLEKKIKRFAAEFPHRSAPYNKRNWGHPLHSLSSYQGKLKPALAHWLVALFSESGMVVADPLGGVGTIPFEACLQGRRGISNDLSPFAYAVATGKTCPPDDAEFQLALARLREGIAGQRLTKKDYESAEFGLNGTVADFFHPQTLDEVLKARRYFLALKAPSGSDLFVKACLLHVLHGNRPYALSRTSHPITPFHPTGEAIYKRVVDHVERRGQAMLEAPLPPSFVAGRSYHGSYLDLPTKLKGGSVDRIITSPPFLGMRFDRPNWLRLWFCGWNADDFHQTSLKFLERQQTASRDVYASFFDVCRELLKSDGVLILHLGGSDSHDMVKELADLAEARFRVVKIVSEDVASVERHGIKDKGLTTSHEYVFAVPR